MTKKRRLDVRGLVCPEPMEAVLEAAASLAPGQYLEVIHFQEPTLLYPVLQKRGFTFLVQTSEQSYITVLIWRSEDTEAKDAAESV